MGLIQEFQKGDAQRRREVAGLEREADAFVRDLHKLSAGRRSEVAMMIQEFEKGDGERRKEVAAMLADADAFVGHLHGVSADRRKEVAALVADADAFVRHLHQLSAERHAQVATMIQEFAKGDAARRQEVAAMRADADAFVGELHRLSAARHVEIWGGAAPAAKPAVPAPAKKAATTLRDVIFSYLAEHPDGAKLTQMEKDLGMARIRIAKEMKGLIDGKKVRKREMHYFAV